MTADDDLTRGRPTYAPVSLPSATNGTSANYVTVEKQEKINADVDSKLADLFAKHDSVRANTLLQHRLLSARVEEQRDELFILQRRVGMMRVYGWFTAITAIAAGISITILWIALPHLVR